MPYIDQNKGWQAVAERLGRTDDVRHRAMLQVLVDHMRAEMDLDLDGMLGGLVPRPEYHTWSAGRDSGPKSLDGVREYYRKLLEVRRGVLEYAIDRIVVDDDTVVTEGVIRAYQPGRAAREFGFDVPDVDATYLVAYRALILWPFDREGRLIGEDGYGTWSPDDFERVPSAELPDATWSCSLRRSTRRSASRLPCRPAGGAWRLR